MWSLLRIHDTIGGGEGRGRGKEGAGGGGLSKSLKHERVSNVRLYILACAGTSGLDSCLGAGTGGVLSAMILE
jgi:hypothetical protein